MSAQTLTLNLYGSTAFKLPNSSAFPLVWCSYVMYAQDQLSAQDGSAVGDSCMYPVAQAGLLMGLHCSRFSGTTLLASTRSCHCTTASKPFLLQGHSFVFPRPNEGSLPSHGPEGVVPGSPTFAGSALCLFYLFCGVISVFVSTVYV